MTESAVINQKEYLKRYLSGDKDGKKKKKKNKHSKENRITVIDDDVSAFGELKEEDIDDDLFGTAEEQPQIVAVIDERPIHLQHTKVFSSKRPWRKIGEDEPNVEDEKHVNADGNESGSLQPIGTKFNGVGCDEKKHSINNASLNAEKEVDFVNKTCKVATRTERNTSSDQPSPKFKAKHDGSPSRQKTLCDTDQSPPRLRKRHDSDQSPPRHIKKHDSGCSPLRQRKRHNSDQSPPRQRKRHDSDQSPPRQRKRNDTDHSPPRQRLRRDSDQSPPRQRKRNDSDQSPLRQRKRIDADQFSPRQRPRHDSDQSPPRQRKRHDSDCSPPRQRRRHDSDQSPTQNKRWQDSNPSHVGRSKRKHSDNSPRHMKKSDPDRISQRRRHDSEQSLSSRKGHNSRHSPSKDIKSTNGYHRGRNDNDLGKCLPTTLSGKKSGLQDSKSLKQENIELKMKEDAAFLQVDEDLLGINAETIVRDRKSGKKIDIPAELLKKREKAQVKQEYLDKYKVWSAGLKQIKDRQQKLDEEADSANKPLARYADDEDLENELKARDRDGDPMLKYFARKRAKQDKKENKPRFPMYQGPPPPMNRFDILPGYRWDGVDRSNGFEKKLFESIGLKKAQEEEAYKWSSADM